MSREEAKSFKGRLYHVFAILHHFVPKPKNKSALPISSVISQESLYMAGAWKVTHGSTTSGKLHVLSEEQ